MQIKSIQYHQYFGLDEQAFSIAVNPRYLYMSEQHREALAHLLFGVKSGGFVMLSGEVGTGKTTIIRCLLEQIPDNADLAIVMNPSASARDLLCSICDEFKLPYAHNETSIKVLTDTLTEFLVKNHMRGRKSIVLIDEAQLLRISTLEQVRLLTNLETNTQKLLQIILVGQPELNELLAKPALRQLSQRITARYHLRPLTEDDTAAYIKHRLKIAGMPPGRNPFPPKIMRRVHAMSRGIPRLINILCDRMLLGAYSKEATEVDAEVCKQAMIEVMGAAPEDKFADQNQKFLYAGAGAAAAFVLALGFWLVFDSGPADLESNPVAPAVNVAANNDVVETVAVAGRDQVAPKVAVPKVAGSEVALPNSNNLTMATSPQVQDDNFWLRNQDSAIELLLDRLGIGLVGGMPACWTVSQKGFQCETQTVATWDDFKVINRPAVLTIQTPTRHKGYVTLIGLRADTAWLLTDSGLQQIDLDRLGRLWTGEFTYVWSRPEAYEEPIGVGSQTPLVTWVARQFALLDNQDKPLATRFFNEALKTRVKLFQRSAGLEDDGYVGKQTLLKLNEALGYDVSLNDFNALAMDASPYAE